MEQVIGELSIRTLSIRSLSFLLPPWSRTKWWRVCSSTTSWLVDPLQDLSVRVGEVPEFPKRRGYGSSPVVRPLPNTDVLVNTLHLYNTFLLRAVDRGRTRPLLLSWGCRCVLTKAVQFPSPEAFPLGHGTRQFVHAEWFYFGLGMSFLDVSSTRTI